nr:hypothetical protein [Microcoleus sp. CAWBG58]
MPLGRGLSTFRPGERCGGAIDPRPAPGNRGRGSGFPKVRREEDLPPFCQQGRSSKSMHK